jgi:DNA-binding PadR family transcriptional regulator
MRRGDIRLALIVALLDGPAHGYELIGRLEERSGGLWRPSAGSVYPTLQLIEEAGLVTGRDDEGKRVYELTDEGRTAAERVRDRGPWGADQTQPTGQQALRRAVATTGLAARQVAMAGDDAQVEAATAIVTEARQRLYRLLAGDTPAAPATDGPSVVEA